MKKIIIYLVTIFTASFIFCYSQHPPVSRNISKFKIVDESNLRITYSLVFKYSVQSKEYHKDTRIVQVGDKIIKDFSAIVYRTDSISTDAEKKGAAGIPSLQDIVYPYEIFNSYEKDKSLVIYRTFISGPILRYFEEQPVFKWELIDGSQIILGYKCQPAKTRFAGREYTAWFTMDLPINAGPYKFNGLPGLILKVEESNGFFIWTATGISKIKEPVVEYEIKEGYQKCTRKQADDIIKKMFEKPYTFIGNYSKGIVIMREDGSFTRGTSENEIAIPYEPLEK